MEHKFMKCSAAMIAAALFGMTGCAAKAPVPDIKETAFSTGYQCISDSSYCFYSETRSQIELLDFSSMNNAALCNKPNCRHTSSDCVMKRLNHSAPIISAGYAFYFIDDEPSYETNESGGNDLKIGSTLYCMDLQNNRERKLLHMDGISASSQAGLLLHDGTIYFTGNAFSRYYDENQMLIGFSSAAGERTLHAVRLSDLQVTHYGGLYDLDTLQQHYPAALNSAEVIMKGLFDNKIYFNVAFVDKVSPEDASDVHYAHYATYLDLADGSYHGTPEDYDQIDFAAVTYCSENHLILYRDSEAAVYTKGKTEPVIIHDERFDIYGDWFAEGNYMFCSENAYDLTTKNYLHLVDMEYKPIIAERDHSYIILNLPKGECFEKIPAEQLLK